MTDSALTLSVRIRHPTYSPDVITQSMQVDPIASHGVGDRVGSPPGLPPGRVRSETYWAHKLLEQDRASLGDALRTASAWLLLRSTFIDSLLSSGGSVEYYITMSLDDHVADEIASDVISLCGRLGVRISLEFFV